MTSLWGICPVLEDVDDDGLDLVEHVRMTGALYSDELGSGEVPRSFYNPAPIQRMAHELQVRCALLEQAHMRRHRIEQLTEKDRLDKIRAEYAALEKWRAHQDEINAQMRMAHRYAEMLRAG